MDIGESDLVVSWISAVVIFEAWKLYESNTPSLAVCRAAESSLERSDVMTQLNDSDLLVGGMILVVAGIFSYYTKKADIVILTGLLLAALSLYRRHVLNSSSTSTPR